MSRVAVIVLSWNTRELLAECLAAVFASQTPPDFFDVWVIDNASKDGSAEMVRQRYPEIHLIPNDTNRGFAGANNQALAQLNSPYALLLNSDAILPPTALADLVACLDQHPRAAAAGPMYLNADASFQASFADFPRLGTELLVIAGLARRLVRPYFPSYGPADSQSARVVDWISGTCLMMRMDTVRLIGLLDEGFFFYSEEVDWCYRASRADWQIWYCPAVAVKHFVSQSARQVSENSLRHLYRGKVRFFAKHRGGWRATVLKLWVVATLAVRAGLALLQSGLGGAPRASWQQYLGLAAMLLGEPTFLPA